MESYTEAQAGRDPAPAGRGSRRRRRRRPSRYEQRSGSEPGGGAAKPDRWRGRRCAAIGGTRSAMEFEERYLKELPSRTTQAATVMAEIEKILKKAKHDCG